ncbi:hypothetical protein FRB93_006341 [Tulasnella sp. JGI-2019a]|nr:hypothetical protein FRB93_006341 [Tulasnella sp. JGI-2019a]
MPPRRGIDPAHRGVLIDRMSIYTVALSVMCCKARHTPHIIEVHKAQVANAPSREAFNASINMKKEWKTFLERMDVICKEETEDPKRTLEVASAAMMAIQVFTLYELSQLPGKAGSQISAAALKRATLARRALGLDRPSNRPDQVSSNPEPLSDAQPPLRPPESSSTPDDQRSLCPIGTPGTLDDKKPEDLFETLLMHHVDDTSYGYTIVRSFSGKGGAGFEIQSADGWDKWDVTPEEMELMLKESTLATRS